MSKGLIKGNVEAGGKITITIAKSVWGHRPLPVRILHRQPIRDTTGAAYPEVLLNPLTRQRRFTILQRTIH